MSPNNRLGTHSAAYLRTLLSERDMAILNSIREHKFLSSAHIYSLHFSTHASYASGIRACTRILNRLFEHRLIYRLQRPVGGSKGGSSSYVWGIDAAGDRVLKDIGSSGSQKRSRAFEPSLMFLAHTLSVADIRIQLEDAVRLGTLESATVSTEPTNWRPFLTGSGAAQILKPDLYAATTTPDFEDYWFIEVDRGTESLPTLLNKCHYYERYRRTGIEQENLGLFPLVLWLIPTASRREALRDAIAKDSRLDPALFRVIAPEKFALTITETADTTTKTAGTQPTKKGGIQ